MVTLLRFSVEGLGAPKTYKATCSILSTQINSLVSVRISDVDEGLAMHAGALWLRVFVPEMHLKRFNESPQRWIFLPGAAPPAA